MTSVLGEGKLIRKKSSSHELTVLVAPLSNDLTEMYTMQAP